MEPVFDPSRIKKKKKVGRVEGRVEDRVEDSTYRKFLDRAFVNIDEDCQVVKIKCPPPIVGKIGGKRTHIENFALICQTLGRETTHVQYYFNAELCTVSSLDAKGGIVIKGFFQPVKVKKIIKNYIQEYITCRVCGAQDTKLTKIERVNYVVCNCGCRKAVPGLKP